MMGLIKRREMRRLFRDGMKISRRAYRRADIDRLLMFAGLRRRTLVADLFADMGFLMLGCMAGVTAGLLLAPRSGMEIRGRFKKAIEQKGIWQGAADSIREIRGSV